MPIKTDRKNNSLKSIMLGVAALTMVASPVTAQTFDDLEKQEIGQIVRDYLLENPELIIEIQQALEDKQEELMRIQQESILSSGSDMIFNNPNDPKFGNVDGDVTIVEFFDYNCGFCRRGLADMEYILENDTYVKFVLKEFPIFGPNSDQVHTVALAFQNVAPEKYLDYHTRMMNQEGQIDEARALQLAEETGVDMDALQAEMANPQIGENLRDVATLANGLGINGTPAYVIGNEVVSGALGKDVLLAKVENMRECGKTEC